MDSLRALARPFGTFERLASRPGPGYAVLLANWVFFIVMGYYAGLVIPQPAWRQAFAAGGPLRRFLALPLATALVSIPLTFLTGGLLHLLCLLCGGRGGYRQSYRIGSASSPLVVIAGLLAPWPWLAFTPFVWRGIVAIAGTEKLHQAPRGRTRAVMGAVFALGACLAVLGGVIGFRRASRSLPSGPSAVSAPLPATSGARP